MGRHEIDSGNLVESIHKATKERKKLRQRTLVRIIPENGVDYSQQYHPLEEFLWSKQIPSYLDVDNTGSDDDYKIDLRELEVDYSN